MKFYLPYILIMFLLLIVAVSGIASIIARDCYVAGAYMIIFIASLLGAGVLFIKLDEEDDNKK